MIVEFRTPFSSFRLAACAVVVACLTLTNSASAQFIEDVSVVDFSTQLGGFGRLAIQTVNGTGFDENAVTHGTNPNEMWLNNGLFAGPNDPLPATPGVDPNPFIVFDLGSVYDLSALDVWNYNEAGGLSTRGSNLVKISAGLTVNSLVDLDNGNNGEFNFAQANESSAYAGETFDLNGVTAVDQARIVRIDIYSNHGDENEFIGLSEVRFTGVDLGFTGDTNLSGGVDLADFQPISDNIFQTVNTRAEGDLNGDGVVDFFDYRQWKDVVDAQIGAGITFDSITGVPEPSSALVLLLGGMAAGLFALSGRARRA